jgi:hypothetical protein
MQNRNPARSAPATMRRSHRLDGRVYVSNCVLGGLDGLNMPAPEEIDRPAAARRGSLRHGIALAPGQRYARHFLV